MRGVAVCNYWVVEKLARNSWKDEAIARKNANRKGVSRKEKEGGRRGRNRVAEERKKTVEGKTVSWKGPIRSGSMNDKNEK